MNDTKELSEKTNSQSDYLKRRIEELEFIVHKSHRRNLVFDDLEKRLGTLENKCNAHFTYATQQFESFKFHHQLVGERVQILEGYHVVSSSYIYSNRIIKVILKA